MSWFLLAIISAVTLAVANLLQRVLLKDEKSNAFAYSLAFQLMCAFLIGIFAFSRGFIMPPVWSLMPNFIIITVLYGSGTLFLFKALQTTEVSEVTIISSSRAFVTIAAALIFFGESFNMTKVFGVFFVLAGVILVSFKKNTFQFNRGTIYVLAFALCFGIAFANDSFILRQADAISYATISFLLPGLFIIAVKPKIVREMKFLLRIPVLFKTALMSVFYSASAVTAYLAYQQGGAVSQIAPINQSVVILTVLLAVIFLKERNGLVKKFFAAIITSIGVLLLK